MDTLITTTSMAPYLPVLTGVLSPLVLLFGQRLYERWREKGRRSTLVKEVESKRISSGRKRARITQIYGEAFAEAILDSDDLYESLRLDVLKDLARNLGLDPVVTLEKHKERSTVKVAGEIGEWTRHANLEARVSELEWACTPWWRRLFGRAR